MTNKNTGIQSRFPFIIDSIRWFHMNNTVGSDYVSAKAGVDRLQDLTLYNYKPDAAFRDDDEWTDYERACRGVVLDDDGNLIALPFPKFFNWSEENRHNTDGLTVSHFETKVDGSLGICFHYKGEWWVTTHGSLDSHQGIYATELLRDAIKFCNAELDTDINYMVEIVYPENRIVTDYGDFTGLYYLAAYNRKTLKEEIHYGVPIVFSSEERIYTKSFSDLLTICKTRQTLEEGYVIVYDNGDRVKLKTEAYLMAHRARFSIRPKYIQDLMLNKPEALLELRRNLPNEFLCEIDDIVRVIDLHVWETTLNSFRLYDETLDGMDTQELSDKDHRRHFVDSFKRLVEEFGSGMEAYFSNVMKIYSHSGKKPMSEIARIIEREAIRKLDRTALFGVDTDEK